MDSNVMGTYMNTYMSYQGYSINKCDLGDDELARLKADLTVTPHVPKDFAMVAPQPFKLYQEGPTKIYVPRHYGISKYGVPRVNRMQEGRDVDLVFNGSLRQEQAAPVKAFMDAVADPAKGGGILNLTCASGKCLAKNTPLLMYDGSTKLVQHIKIDDMLMGDDSTPRRVLGRCFGVERMYSINQNYGKRYTVNESHILSLKQYDPETGVITKVDMSVTEFLSHPQRRYLYGYKAPVQFASQEVACDPYELGKKMGTDQYDQNEVPRYVKFNDHKVVRAFLQGFIDAQGASYEMCDIIILKNVYLLNDIRFMLRCVGSLIEQKEIMDQVHLHVYGLKPTTNILHANLMYKIHVVPMVEDMYYGFEIDGNRRFLLDDFTVTHNTVMAIYLMCQVKKKALVVVHKDFLLQQWKERIEQFCPTARIGLIKAKTVDTEDKDIVIASLQSLSMKKYEPDTFSDFGFVIADECHHTSAEVFSRALRKVNFKYSLGLSATVKRKDGLSKVFMWYLGGILYSNVKNKGQKDEVDVQLHYYYDPYPDYSKEVYMMGNKLNISKMINNICEYSERQKYIVDCVKEILAKEPERKIIILSDRRAHLENVGKLLAREGIENGNYFGGMKPNELKVSESKQVLLGTFCMVSEGFDCKSLDTLILASPKSDVTQSCGRILREEAAKRRHVPLIVDIIDQFSIFERQGKKRLTYYKSQKYNLIGEQKTEDVGKLMKLDKHSFVDLEEC